MDYTSDEDFLSESGDSSVLTETYREEIEFEEPEEVDPNSNKVKSDLHWRKGRTPRSRWPMINGWKSTLTKGN